MVTFSSLVNHGDIDLFRKYFRLDTEFRIRNPSKFLPYEIRQL